MSVDVAAARCADRWYQLKPVAEQVRLISERSRFAAVAAGRRCLERGTLVATPTGPVPIDSLAPGDAVIGFNGSEPEVTVVTECHVNGEQLVTPLLSGRKEYLAATEGHKLFACEESSIDASGRRGSPYRRVPVCEISDRHRVRSVGFDWIRLRKGTPRLAMTYDITVGNSTNLYILHHGGIVTSNSGKTERAKRHLVKAAMREVGPYFAAAPTHDQAERIWWDDLKLLSFSDLHPRRPNESRKVISLPNGSTIHVIGLDKPSRIEGTPWMGGVIDEIADTKPKTWTAHIRPALDTANPSGYLAWCWLIGVPDGLNHFYDICEQAKTSPDWGYYHWTSSEVLSPEVIQEARRALSAREFNQEYLASFENATGRIYSDYSEDNHTDTTIQPHERLMWAHDFNFTPMSSCIAVKRGDAIHLLDEIVLESAVARQAAEEFVHRYAKHGNKSVIIYGDPAGRAGEKHAHASDYTEIERVLRQAGWSVERRVASKAPAITARQAAVRAAIKSAAGDVRLLVNPHTASWCHRALATVQYLPGSAYQEDQRNQYQHISTAIGYMIHREGNVSGARGVVGLV